MSHTFTRYQMTSSEDVYIRCLQRRNPGIVNKDLITTQQSNTMRIAQKLSSTNLGGNIVYVNMITGETSRNIEPTGNADITVSDINNNTYNFQKYLINNPYGAIKNKF